MNLTIIRTSASRPELLIESTETLRKNLKFSGEIRWILHEDVLNREASNECVEYIKSVGNYKIIVDDPPIGQGNSLNKMYELVDTDFLIAWEDDHTCTRELNLDIPYKILKENNDVNQVVFNKRDTMPSIGEPPRQVWYKKVIERSGVQLTSCPHWRLTPAMWKKSFIDKFWIPANKDSREFNWEINIQLRHPHGYTMNDFLDADWAMKNIGTYYLGGIDEKRYCYHIGGGKSIREFKYKWSK